MNVKLIHADDEEHILYIARVSSNQENTDPGLISFLIRQNHWSPFEMVSACIEINTTRDIGRQILRHRSFSFQEFSQRYAAAGPAAVEREMRLKGSTNRQGSLDDRSRAYEELTADLAKSCFELYGSMLNNGVAPECARSILPEGFTQTRLYMHGTLRSWIHYLRERTKLDPNGKPYAQREHYFLAQDIHDILRDTYPMVFIAIESMEYFK